MVQYIQGVKVWTSMDWSRLWTLQPSRQEAHFILMGYYFYPNEKQKTMTNHIIITKQNLSNYVTFTPPTSNYLLWLDSHIRKIQMFIDSDTSNSHYHYRNHHLVTTPQNILFYTQCFNRRKARRGDDPFVRQGGSLEAIEAVASVEKWKKENVNFFQIKMNKVENVP